jgi:hypothetical protein
LEKRQVFVSKLLEQKVVHVVVVFLNVKKQLKAVAFVFPMVGERNAKSTAVPQVL